MVILVRTKRHVTWRAQGISIGSESSGGIKDILIHDNVIGLCEKGSCLDKCRPRGPPTCRAISSPA